MSPYVAAGHSLFKWVPVLESSLQSVPPDARFMKSALARIPDDNRID